MATITSPSGSLLPGSTDFEVDIGTVVTNTATEYAWTFDQDLFGNNNLTSRITLVGSFTYSGGTPSGQVAQIRIDTDNDSADDLVIAYSSLQPILSDLIGGDENAFWEAAISQNNTVNLGGATLGIFALGPRAAVQNAPGTDDAVTITGHGTFSLDATSAVNNYTGGNDTATINASDPHQDIGIHGDARSVGGFGATVTGGTDSITDVTTQGVGRVFVHGDFRSANASDVVNGGNDTIIINNREAIIYGDLEFISSNVDTFNAGSDTLTGGTEDDRIYGDLGYSGSSPGLTIFAGSDIISGGGGDDEIYGEHSFQFDGAGGAVIVGGGDQIDGGAGNDIIFGQHGNDFINGGDDDDIISGGEGDDLIDGDGGIDTADFSLSIFAVNVVLGNPGTSGSATGNGTDVLREIENVTLTTLNDTFTGNNQDNYVIEGGGNDVLNGNGGIDTISYERASGGVTVNLALTGIQSTIGGGDDTLSSFENLVGSDHDDTLSGDGGNNVIDGGDGNDVIDGGAGGDNIVRGGDGDDRIIRGSGSSLEDAYYGDGGFDTFVSNSSNLNANITINLAANQVQLSGNLYEIIESFESYEGAGFEAVIGTSKANIITMTGNRDNTINGHGGNDTITGGLGDDMIDGGADEDTAVYAGQSSNYTVSTVGGITTVIGGGGTDTLTNIEWLRFDDQTIWLEEPPVAMVDDQPVLPDAWLQLAPILTVTDPNGDVPTWYQLWDSTGGDNWFVTGTGFVDASAGYWIAAADLNDTWLRGDASPSSQTLWIQAFDSTAGAGPWDDFTLTTLAPQEPPVATVEDQTLAPLGWASLSSILTITDVNGDTPTWYQLWDSTGGDNWWVSGTGYVDASAGYWISASDLANTWLQGDASASSQTLYIQAFDTAAGPWDDFVLTTT